MTKNDIAGHHQKTSLTYASAATHQADYLRFLDGLDTHSRLNMGSEVY